MEHMPIRTEQIIRQEKERKIIAQELVKYINTKMLIRAKVSTA